jgi:hypothetical protein
MEDTKIKVKTSNIAKKIRVVVRLDSGGEECVFKDTDVRNVIRTMSKKIIYQDSVIDELQSENIELPGLVVDTLDRKIELLEQSKGKEPKTAPKEEEEEKWQSTKHPFPLASTLRFYRNGTNSRG